MKNQEILLLGDINIDTTWPVSEFPVPGRDGLVDSISLEVGGAVVNSAVVLDNLGQPAGLLGCIGNDTWGQQILNNLSKSNIDQSHIHTLSDKKVNTGITFIIVTPDGERTMFSQRGANVFFEPRFIDEKAFSNASVLHISGYALLEVPQKDAALQAIHFAKEHNVDISLDTGLEPVIQNPKELHGILSDLTICITGPQELDKMFACSQDEAIEQLLSLGIQIVAVKMGKKGSLIVNENERIFCPSFHINAVDTTGAGDSYSAGLLYGWVNNLSLHASAILASALGALAASVYGAGFALPDEQIILNFLRSERKNSPMQQQGWIDEIMTALEAA
jgi:ribokinase